MTILSSLEIAKDINGEKREGATSDYSYVYFIAQGPANR